MQNKCMVEGFPVCNLEIDFLEHFIYGKNHMRYPYRDTRGKWIMELIHSDILGTIAIPSLGGSLYYVYSIDDFFGKTWLYFLRKKYEAYNKFKEFKYILDNQT
jgi:hypothetical protein